MNPFAEVDTETVTNEQGGKQSRLDLDFTLVPFDGLADVVEVLQADEVKYGRDNWRDIPRDDHIKHFIAHAIAAVQTKGADSQTHLAHAVCRAFFALETAEKKEPLPIRLQVGQRWQRDDSIREILSIDDRGDYREVRYLCAWESDPRGSGFSASCKYNTFVNFYAKTLRE